MAGRQAEVIAGKILLELDRSYEIGEIQFHNTPSIGVTLFGDRLEDTEEPLKRADTAMYQAKAAGRNTVRFFDPMMQAAVSARLQLETDLRSAMGGAELFCCTSLRSMSAAGSSVRRCWHAGSTRNVD